VSNRAGNSRIPAAVRLCASFALVALATIPLAAQGMRIVPLIRDGAVMISFELADGFTEDVRAAIKSGLKTTFTYYIDLRAEVPAWVDRTMASAVVSTAVTYDNLTRRHTVVRTLDGRVEQARVTESDNDVRLLVTKIDRLPLFRTLSLEPNREYYVRVRAEVRPRNAAFLWPWGSGRSAQAKFTFIP
jgi:hypothetical protein